MENRKLGNHKMENNKSSTLVVEHLRKQFKKRVVVKDVSFNVKSNEVIGLLGPNGAGKTTLIKVLAGEMQASQGKIQKAEALDVGYFAQHQLEQLRLDESPLWHLQKLDNQATEK